MSFLSRVLPSNSRIWHAYVPVIRTLKNSFEYRNMMGMVNRELRLSLSDRVLDAGCGNGFWLKENLGLFGTGVGIDGEYRMILEAISSLGGDPRIELRDFDLNFHLPFENDSFDKIVNMLVLGYLEEGGRVALDEFARMLKPGGRVAVATPVKHADFYEVLKSEVKNRENHGSFWSGLKRLPLGALAVIFGKIVELKETSGEYHFHTKEELESEFKKRGLRVVFSSYAYANQAIVVVAEKPIV